MKKIRVMAMFLLMTFLTTMISPNLVYAREKLEENKRLKEEVLNTEEVKDSEKSFIEKEILLLEEYKAIINKLNTEDNISKFIITNQEIEVILKEMDLYEKSISNNYINGIYNKSIDLFELRQKIVNNCNLYANSRATNEEIKGKLNNLSKEIVNLNDKLCKEIIEFLDLQRIKI